jgi:protein-S-isoprenylcysteine O-methyltransferase Ste14
MTEKILVILLSLTFLGAFVTRNLIVKAKTKKTIRASDPLLTASMIFTTLCVFVTIFSTSSDNFHQYLGAILFLNYPAVSYFGLILFALSIIMGWLVSAQLKESWRVGVHDNQKTVLIQSGIYKYIRNPYFLSYFIMFIGQFLVRPSFVMIVLVAITIAIFHRMVLKEEAYLLKIHKKEYEEYRGITGRYIPRRVIGDRN